MIYFKLFYEFFKIGLLTVGGGLATLPFLKNLAERTEWFPVTFVTDMIAISESTPGPIGLNMATYAGFKVVGILGGVVATIGEIVPSIIIVILVSRFLESFQNNKNIGHAFYGIRPIVTALITVAGLQILSISIINSNLITTMGVIGSINIIKVILFVIIFYLIRKYNKHPTVYIALSGIIGILLNLAES